MQLYTLCVKSREVKLSFHVRIKRRSRIQFLYFLHHLYSIKFIALLSQKSFRISKQVHLTSLGLVQLVFERFGFPVVFVRDLWRRPAGLTGASIHSQFSLELGLSFCGGPGIAFTVDRSGTFVHVSQSSILSSNNNNNSCIRSLNYELHISFFILTSTFGVEAACSEIF